MESLWDEKRAAEIAAQSGDLGLRVYSSQLLGANPDLVLHGGGNTSFKGHSDSLLEGKVETLFVKGSGWDLKTIEAAGFSPVRLKHMLKLAELDSLSDTEMMRQLRLALLDPKAPTPSVEAILHALIPHRFVDHTHTDAVVTLSNSEGGPQRLAELFGDEVLILPYVMPGFVLAKQVAEASSGADWRKLKGIVLLHHGLFTFADDARSSYEAMIELVTKAEGAITRFAQSSDQEPAKTAAREGIDHGTPARVAIAKLRKRASHTLGAPALLRLALDSRARTFAQREDAAQLIVSGPLTPDHTIHTKPFGAVFADDDASGLDEFVECYQEYFAANAGEEHTRLDCMPRFGVWLERGVITLAPSVTKLAIVEDIVSHTLDAMQVGEQLGGWRALPRAELFDVEYWELEQAKLNAAPASSDPKRELEGKIALVTGAGSGIGLATCHRLASAGAAVAALDIDAKALEQFAGHSSIFALRCDITDAAQCEAALDACVQRFGGLDILVSNAGLFPTSQTLEQLEDAQWNASLELNLTAPMRLLRACAPLLEQGYDPAVVLVASKNVPAPGPGAAAYSAAKAGLTQLGRVAALELGGKGIRVNTLHPDAVYDTALWSEDTLAQRAAAYGLSVQAYKTKNLLATEVSSTDVAEAVFLFAGTRLAKSTGVQLPVDGGNERVV